MLMLPRWILKARNAWTTRHRSGNDDGLAGQRRAFRRLAATAGRAAFGRAIGWKEGIPYAKFRGSIPLIRPTDIVPWIDRMTTGEPDLLWPGSCRTFALTRGTHDGTRRLVPVTREMNEHFQSAAGEALLFLQGRQSDGTTLSSRRTLLTTAAALVPLQRSEPDGALYGDWESIVSHHIPADLIRHSDETGPDADSLDPQLTSLILATPEKAMRLARDTLDAAGKSGRSEPGLRDIWPGLCGIIHGGAPLGLAADPLRRMVGPGVLFHEIYAAAEGFIAAQDSEPEAGLRLLTNHGVFYEFLPRDLFDHNHLAHLGPKAISLDDVQTGVDYALVMTTPSGLCRRVTGDFVRFISTRPPRLIFTGRSAHLLNEFGENVQETELTATLLAVCRRYEWEPVHFHVAPLFSEQTAFSRRGFHEWWIELKSPSIKTPMGEPIAAELDAEMKRRNPEYASRRSGQSLHDPVVRLVAPGIFARWRRDAHHGGETPDIPPCRPDRRIADALAGITRFSDPERKPSPPD